MRTTSRIFFCCLNSKKTKSLELTLLFVNIICLILYIILFSTISWGFIHILYKILFHLNLIFLLIGMIINIYFIYLRRKRLINFQMNNIALALSILIILLSIIAIIINFSSTYNILSQFKKLNEQNIIYYKSKGNNIISIMSIIIIDIEWVLILFIWIADFVRLKIKSEDSFYNYLKIKSFKKNFYLFKEEYNKESNFNLKIKENKTKNTTIIKNKIMNLIHHPLKFNANNQLIDENNSNNNNIMNPNNLNNSSNSSNLSHSKNSSSLSDSYQKPVNMIIIGTDEKGYPIYKKESSFDKSHNDSISFNEGDKNFNKSNFIKFNDISLNNEDTMNDININFEKNHILEKDSDDINPKVVEKVNENENENENDNNNDYKDHFIPLQSGEIEKEIENKDTEEQKTKINE